MISIAMATYNGAEFVAEQIESILEQTYTDFELIISDDCSKDNTVEILNQYAAKDKRIKIIINENNLGFKKNFEQLISMCHGDYIAFCDQDDIWTINHLEILINEIKDKDLVCGNADLIDKDGNKMNITTYECLSNFNLPEQNEATFKKLLYGNFAQGTAMMIKKNIANKIIPIPDCCLYHDWWAASIAAINNGCTYTNKKVLLYRQHGTNQTVTKKYKIIASIKNALQQRKNIKEEYKQKIEFASELEQRTSNPAFLSSINESKEYYTALLHNPFKAISLFKKNYSDIYWVRNPSKKLFWLRFIKVFLLKI
ncbi:Glycosyltransferase involved in cell wall bisynthesis [Treponema bryantii]|uniref:Glycosyltransferase involved in cell wall bisynthesis n=1 Tax=Treponema bryantii TaxID=163 RepID=A0A1H9J3Q9_9SPIR|nr:glycosyltransferase family 2 protein [Treponema bryantii]SEQ81412.1 Glycosyltransferase involved in cell wall bisynthesis [Treponema bryantii]